MDSIGETLIGRGDKAMEYYKAICPPSKEDQIDIYRSEPYVYSQMTAGNDAATTGEAKNSWLTGTAAWSFVALSNYILGIQPDYNGLIINPCIPKEWNNFKVIRKFRNSTYQIEIINQSKKSKGITTILVDNLEIEGNKIPLFEDNKTHKVLVTM